LLNNKVKRKRRERKIGWLDKKVKRKRRERKVDLLDKKVKRKIRGVSRSQKGKREVREKEYMEEEE